MPIAAEQADAAIGARDGVFDQRAGKTDTPVIAQNRTCACHIGDATGRRIGKADFLKGGQGGVVNIRHPLLA
jgi:hypothetical protein